MNEKPHRFLKIKEPATYTKNSTTNHTGNKVNNATTTGIKDYKVLEGEGLIKLAKKHNTTVDKLKALNSNKLKTWGKTQGFNKGEVIKVPKNG